MDRRFLLAPLMILFALVPVASAQCVTPTDGMVVSSSTTLCPGKYNLPNGLTIDGLYINLWCQGATLNGVDGTGYGVTIYEQNFVTLYDCNIANYSQAVYIGDSQRVQAWNLNMQGNGEGLVLFNSVGGKFYDIIITDTQTGVRIGGFSDNNILHDFHMQGVSTGIQTDSINSNNVFYQSTINGPGNGIVLTDASGYVIYGNTITSCTKNGISLKGSALGNMIFSNRLDGCSITGDTGILGGNLFCNGLVGNTYLNGATGPNCTLPTEPRIASLEANITGLWNGQTQLWQAISLVNQSVQALKAAVDSMGATVISVTASVASINQSTNALSDGLCFLSNFLHVQNPFIECQASQCQSDSDCGQDGFVGDGYCHLGDVYRNFRDYMCIQAVPPEESFCRHDDIPTLVEDCLLGCDNGACITIQQCSGTDVSCGLAGQCQNCNSMDACHDGLYRDYGCSSQACVPTETCTEACCDAYHQSEEAYCELGQCHAPEQCSTVSCFDLCRYDLDCCKGHMLDKGTCYWSNSKLSSGCRGTTEVCD